MSVPAQTPQDVTFDRLEDQISWYDRNSGKNKKYYVRLKICTMVFAAAIPVGATRWPVGAGILGALIVVIEGIQQLYTYHANWQTYRSTSESLKHEKFLYLAQAGQYTNPATAHVLLAEKIESLVSQEHARWAGDQEKAAQKNPPAA